MLQIGQVAKASGIGVETIRYYESEGLIARPRRSASGYRQYSVSIVDQIKFIQHAKKVGFSLKEVGELIELKNVPGARCDKVKVTAIAKVADIQKKIDALEQIKAVLLPLVDQCISENPISDCPIMKTLDGIPANN